MAEETRDLPEMVEKAMGAGGAPMTMEQQLSLEIQDDIEQLPEGVELDTGEEPVVEQRFTIMELILQKLWTRVI